MNKQLIILTIAILGICNNVDATKIVKIEGRLRSASTEKENEITVYTWVCTPATNSTCFEITVPSVANQVVVTTSLENEVSNGTFVSFIDSEGNQVDGVMLEYTNNPTQDESIFIRTHKLFINQD